MLAALFAGDTVILPPHFDPREVWRAVERHKVNLIFIVGDTMGRPLIEAYGAGEYDAASMLAISSSGALFSAVVKDAFATALPGVVITDAIGSTETASLASACSVSTDLRHLDAVVDLLRG